MNIHALFQRSFPVPEPQKLNFLLAVSGGLDSTVLCELSKQAGLSFAMAHCNFQLRGQESNRDEAFVRSLGEKYGAQIFVNTTDAASYAVEHKLSIQEAARDIRYNWFGKVMAENGFDYTLLAHHADDNIETLLINFFRGTGLDGLTGMPVKKVHPRCLRPMLQLRRKDIEVFAKENHLEWVEDSSNASSKYTRNFFRNDLLPMIRTAFPQVDENLLRNIGRLQQTAALYNEMLAGLKKKICVTKGEETHIPVLRLMQYGSTSFIYEIIRDFGFGEGSVGEVLKLAEAESGRYISNEKFRIIRHRRWLIIAPLSSTAQTVVIEKGDDAVRFGNQELRIRRMSGKNISVDPSAAVAQVDAGEIEYPLILRQWKAGDYFYPLGMKKKKKLSRFFIDQKLSKTEKEKAWVLESHKRIVWVVGYRIDDRFKLTGNTKEVLSFALQG